jgi:PEP-CTERM motif
MRRVVFATVFPILLIAVGHPSEASPITYTIQNYPADQNGATLSGTITTDGAVGTLATTDFLSWSWTITPPGETPLTLSSSDAGAQVFLFPGSVLVASQSAITIAPRQDSIDGSSFALESLSQGGEQLSSLEYDRPGSGGGPSFYSARNNEGADIWFTQNPAMGGTDPWVIALAGSAVPEPSSILLLSLGTAGVLLIRSTLWRSRRQHRRETP